MRRAIPDSARATPIPKKEKQMRRHVSERARLQHDIKTGIVKKRSQISTPTTVKGRERIRTKHPLPLCWLRHGGRRGGTQSLERWYAAMAQRLLQQQVSSTIGEAAVPKNHLCTSESPQQNDLMGGGCNRRSTMMLEQPTPTVLPCFATNASK